MWDIDLKLTHKIYLLQIILAFILFGFLTFTYLSYEKQYQKDIDEYVKQEVQIKKEEILKAIKEAAYKIKQQKKLYLKIHQTALDILKKDSSMDLYFVKKRLVEQFDLENIKIELFLIDKTYTIYKTTFPKDLGFNLSVIIDAKDMLDKTTKDKKIHIADIVSVDSLDLSYNIYTYSYLNNSTYLELGFINKEIINPLPSIISSNPNITIYTIENDNKNWSYYRISIKKDIKSKKQLYKNQERFPIGKTSYGNKIIDSHLLHKTFKINNGNIVRVITPLYNEKMYSQIGRENLIMDIRIDIADKLEILNKTKNIFILSLMAISILLMLIFLFIKKNFTKKIDIIVDSINQHTKITDPSLLNNNDELSIVSKEYNKLFESLNKEIHINKELLAENKRFIADTVHQIRTPLTNIMMNSEMIEITMKDDRVSNFIDQINASINMLTNSYEDLSYILSYDNIEYKATKISVSDIVNKRIKFFTTISKVNFKDIVSNIEKNIFFTINQIELERLIDNNISNAIKYATANKPIIINLIQTKEQVMLEFKTYGKSIHNTSKLFEKNYRENNEKRGLGLGLNMVKAICQKYDIKYEVSYEDGQNIFTYIFKA